MEAIRHYRHWVYVAVRAIMESAGNHKPNLDYVSSNKPSTSKIRNKVWRKSVNRIAPSDKVEPLEEEHPLRTLLEYPNAMDSPFDFWSELALFIKLTGNGFIWMVPNEAGYPCELWVLPSHWMWILPGKDRYVEWYELRPWTSYTGAPALRIPPRDVMHIRCKSPITKIDGFATTTGLAQWIDIYESMITSQWSAFKNGTQVGNLHMELGPEYSDPTDQELDRIYEKFFYRFQGEFNAGLPIITPPGSKLNNLSFSPMEMSYNESDDRVRDKVLAGFGVPRPVVGLFNDVIRSNVDGSLVAFGHFTMNPYYCMVGEKFSHTLCKRFEHDKRIKLWWPDSVPIDPQQVNQDITTRMDYGLWTLNEARAHIGMPAYKMPAANNPFMQGGLKETPMNVEMPKVQEESLPSFDEMPAQRGGNRMPFPVVPAAPNGKHS